MTKNQAINMTIKTIRFDFPEHQHINISSFVIAREHMFEESRPGSFIDKITAQYRQLRGN